MLSIIVFRSTLANIVIYNWHVYNEHNQKFLKQIEAILKSNIAIVIELSKGLYILFVICI